jgi:hypothetical protein
MYPCDLKSDPQVSRNGFESSYSYIRNGKRNEIVIKYARALKNEGRVGALDQLWFPEV